MVVIFKGVYKMEPIQIIDYKNHTIKICYDEFSESPREWDNLGSIYAEHSKYNLCDKDITIDTSEINNWDDVKNQIIKEHGDCIILPIYLYKHSGISLNTTGFSCSWDSGQVGYIFVTKDKIRKEYRVKRISNKLIEKVKSVLISEVENYSNFINGEVYEYIIEDDQEGKYGCLRMVRLPCCLICQ
jgi:hypothetical protein